MSDEAHGEHIEEIRERISKCLYHTKKVPPTDDGTLYQVLHFDFNMLLEELDTLRDQRDEWEKRFNALARARLPDDEKVDRFTEEIDRLRAKLHNYAGQEGTN